MCCEVEGFLSFPFFFFFFLFLFLLFLLSLSNYHYSLCYFLCHNFIGGRGSHIMTGTLGSGGETDYVRILP